MTNFAICGLNAVDERPDHRAMMGLQATTTALAGSPPPPHHQYHHYRAQAQQQHHAQAAKRRHDGSPAHAQPEPAKAARWDAPPTPEDCIARLRAVAENAWARPAAPVVPPTALAQAATPPGQTVLSDDEFDDEEFEELEEETSGRKYGAIGTNGSGVVHYGTARYHPTANHQHHPPHHAPPHHHQAEHYWQAQCYGGGAPAPAPQQTIRRENGKSYLELGPPAAAARRCCARWCRPAPCYRQRRLAVLNLSVCKLARYRQCSDPSLRRSVLICNTLRRLEREMESEPADAPFPTHPDPAPPRLAPPPDLTYEHQLRELSGSSGRATPFPSFSSDADSGVGTLDDDDRPINWGSVLSLSSQTGVEEPLNNNELYAELGLMDEWERPAAVAGT